jgi:hypothetical protein
VAQLQTKTRDVVFQKSGTGVTELMGIPTPIGQVISMRETGADLSAAAVDQRIACRLKTEIIQDDAGSMWAGVSWSKTTLGGEIVSLPA